MSKKKKAGIVALVILAVLAVVLAVNRELVRILFSNAFARTVKLDESGEWSGGTSYEKLPYSDVSESDYLNLYVPDTGETPPLFVLIHGGGFVTNDNESRQAQFMYRYFRDHGFACASVNYRLADEAAYPGAIDDVKAAIRFLKANADKYGYDASKVAVWGESAGGYLALMAGVTTDEDFHGVTYIGEEDAAETVTADVQAVVDFYGVTGLSPMLERFTELGIPKFIIRIAALWLTDALKDTGYDDVESYWLRTDLTECSEEELYLYSTLYYMDKNVTEDSDLKLLIWHGDADLDVPYTQSEELLEHAAGILGEENVSLKIFHNYKHAADSFYSDENLETIRDWLEEAIG